MKKNIKMIFIEYINNNCNMPIYRSIPSKRMIHEKTFETSEVAIVVDTDYTTNGERVLIVKGSTNKIFLDSTTTDRITIKAMTDVIIVADKPIDEDINEIYLNISSSVDLRFVHGNWYIMASDGIKTL